MSKPDNPSLVPMEIVCTDNNPRPAGSDPAVLEVGKTYTLIDVDMGGSLTLLKLEEVEGWFNSVHFDLDDSWYKKACAEFFIHKYRN